MKFLLTCFWFLCLLNTSSSAERSISKPCQRRCGNVSIPFPFGIGSGCYFNKWYEISCGKSTGKFIPFLPKIKKEVVEIELPTDEPHLYGSLRIKTEMASMACSGDDGHNMEKLLNFTETTFFISTDKNYLMVHGCNTKATLTNINPILTGCISECVPEEYQSYLDSECHGERCCNTSVPSEVHKEIGVKIERNNVNKSREECSVAFLTDRPGQASLWPNRSDPKRLHQYAMRYSTIELWWGIFPGNRSFLESMGCREYGTQDSSVNHCQCDWDEIYSEISCACIPGYEGNPYSHDCKDIDECKQFKEDGRPMFCDKHGQTCRNIPGSHECETKKFLIYIGVGTGLGGLLIICVGICLHRFIKKYRETNLRKEFFERNGGILLQKQLASREGSVDKKLIFSSKELEKATESFSSNMILGHGGQGTVFKGRLVDDTIVAVKKARAVDEDKLEEFINEVFILSHLNHPNVVNILGCCLETEVPLLVYEFIPNGNLFQLLHGDLENHALATWELRMRIALESAEALTYLHSAAASPIYHRDVKSANILLDENYRAKISDFGTSRTVTVDQTHLTTVVTGTAGYLDPEYFESCQYTEKSDVFSFGVVLAEIITGQKSVSFLSSGESKTLATSFSLSVKENKVFEVIDSRIRDGCNLEQVMVVAKIARRCLNRKGKKRPTMREVLLQLESSSQGALQTGVDVVEDDEGEIVEVDKVRRFLTSEGEASTSKAGFAV